MHSDVTLYNLSVEKYLLSFDMDIIQICFNGQNVLSTWRNIRSLNTRTFICYNLTDESVVSRRSITRIQKYYQKNCKFLNPHKFPMNDLLSLPTHRIKNTQIHYHSSTNDQFRENTDYFELQKDFANKYFHTRF